MKIVFCGSQSVGKTTILNHYKELGYPVITEVVRKLAKTGVKINEDGNSQGQDAIFSTYYKLLSETKDYFSDRCLIDVLSYTTVGVQDGKIDKSVAAAQLERAKQFVKDNPDVVYCYFPIEFDVVNDGVRSLDEGYRKRVGDTILNTLKALDIPYVEIRGTVEERIATVEKILLLEGQREVINNVTSKQEKSR